MDQILKDIFLKNGKELILDVTNPFLANDASKIWYISKGSVNLSGTKVIAGEAVGKLQDFTTLFAGQSFFGIALQEYNSLCFLASPQEESIVHELSIENLKKWSREKAENLIAFDGFVRDWVETLYRGLEDDGPKPIEDEIIRSGWSGDIARNKIFTTKQKAVWFEVSDFNALRFNDLIEIDREVAGCLLPVSRHGYIRVTKDLQILAEQQEISADKDALWRGLEVFHAVVMAMEGLHLDREMEEERKRLIRKHQLEDEQVADMLERATAIITPNRTEAYRFDSARTKSGFFNACLIVAGYENIELTLPSGLDKAYDPLEEISRHSSIRYREIMLEGAWYQNDGGPFLAFLKAGDTPVAVLPDKQAGYMVFNPETQDQHKVTVDNFNDFLPTAYMFYKPFPAVKMGIWDILRFSILKDKSDYFRLLGISMVITLLGMLVPILTAKIFDNIIPSATKNQLIYVAFGLGMAAVGSFLFSLTKSIALLRIESKTDQKLQSAVWDRLLNLPTTFFRQFSAGDLAVRSLGIGRIRKLLSGVVISSVLGGVFSCMNLILLFYYSATLAWIAVLLILLQVLVNYTVGRQQVKRQKVLLAAAGKNSGIVLQLLSGITKFRVSGTEQRAFTHWMKHFLPVKETTIRLRYLQNFQLIFNQHYRTFTLMIIYLAMVRWTAESGMSIGQFLAFNAAYGTFAMAMMGLSDAMITLLQVGPLYERTQPILDEIPENSSAKAAPEPLKGNIELTDIRFRYDPEGPYVLNNVSIQIKKGEYVAFVGPSGSGKSTIIRLLLGFNEVESGAIFFDGQDLSHIDPRMVRQQIGVVLQDGSLMAGDIFSNIIGSSTTLTIKDAWAAAEAAAFDKDVHDMPMGMHTVVSESGGTLSGGQKQRLMIARALVHRPKILIFDEATSALDNHTQAIVSESLDQLNVTRIVVAHRLSTIENADTIYYLDSGEIKEKGSFDELMELKGKFYELAARQLE